ncbi:MAG: substrate-binding domain-containing protein [Edaphocola sp.]
MMKNLYIFILFCIYIAATACGDKAGHSNLGEIRIGFSQCIDNDMWRQAMLQEMRRELNFHPNVTLKYKQADGNSDKQIAQINELTKSGIDILIVSPNEAGPLTPVVEQAYKQGIPVIVIDRKIEGDNYTAYIGADNREIGILAGQYAAKVLAGKGRVKVITGLPKSSPAIERLNGFMQAIGHYPQISLDEVVNGGWLRDSAYSKILKDSSIYKCNLIFAQNDMMALGAVKAIEKRGLPHIPVMGVDALYGKGAGIDLIMNKTIIASLLYPTGGEEAIRTALQIMDKKKVAKNRYLPTIVIDSLNVLTMKLQTDKLNEQQASIEKQAQLLENQERKYSSQRTLLYILVCSFALALLFSIIAFVALNANRRKNRLLFLQNEEIKAQKIRIEKMADEAEANHQIKLDFFTNISHEFRTPLSLIAGPAEVLQGYLKSQGSKEMLQHATVIRKNANRLLGLVNQLLDLRKIEVQKMPVNYSNIDLVDFVGEIISQYRSIAAQKNIDLRLFTEVNTLFVRADAEMLDKVIFNLLSNAIKFTAANGYIHIYMEHTEQGARIRVEDNGIGIGPDDLAHIFELFYQGKKEAYGGSGIGLALAKEMVGLLGGSIEAASKPGLGTTFTVTLPFAQPDNEALPAPALVTAHYTHAAAPDESLVAEGSAPTKEEQKPPPDFKNTILVVEDNADLRRFIASLFHKDYQVLEASDSKEALELAFEYIPELIITDVMIPGQNGNVLTKIFKTDLRTAHIPVIILSARSNEAQQIESIRSMADVYLMKPVSPTILEEMAKNLLSTREKLKTHYSGNMPTTLKTDTNNKEDRQFASEFATFIEQNYENEQLNVDEICKALRVSKVQLYRKTKSLLNISVNEYLIDTRLKKAKYLLASTKLTISEIAFKVGFSTPAYFSTCFKSKFKTTPKEFRNHPQKMANE